MTNQLGRALLAGIGLAIVGVVVFFMMYRLLSGAEPATRLFASMLVPPVVIGIIVFGYYILRQNN